MSVLKLVFLGSDPIALPLLNWLAGPGREIAQVAAVYTQPDRPVGRGQKITANAIKRWAEAQGIPVYQPGKLTDEVQTGLAALAPDVALVMAYGHIFKDPFIATPRLGTLNLHTSILPKYRGASPIQTAIASGETETGVTLMRIVRELDAGPVAEVERVAIGPGETAMDIEAKLADACVPLLARNLPKLAAGTLAFAEQDHHQATFCRKLTKADGGLDFAQLARILAARINGLYPWPACTVIVAGQPVKLGRAEVTGGSGKPGEVVGQDEGGLLIGTGHELLRVDRLQRPGGRMLPGGEFLRGWPVAKGTIIPSVPMAVLVASKPFQR